MMNNYKYGGGIENENAEMVMNNNNQIKHHTEELEKIVTPETEVPAWVVSKVGRSASDLSDATHYLDGVSKMKYADGGKVFKMAKLSMKPYAFKEKIKFVKENPEILAGKFADGGGVGDIQDKIDELYVYVINEAEADELEERGITKDDLYLPDEQLKEKVLKSYGWILDENDVNAEYYLRQRVLQSYYEIFSDEDEYADGGGVGEFYVGQSIMLDDKLPHFRRLTKDIQRIVRPYYNVELVIEEIIPNKPYNFAKTFVKSSGQKVPFEIKLNEKYIQKYADGGGVAISRYRLVPYKERVKGYIESVGEKQVVVESTYEGASQKAVELLYSERDFVTVDIVKLGKSVLSSKKIAKVNSQGIVKYADGGGVGTIKERVIDYYINNSDNEDLINLMGVSDMPNLKQMAEKWVNNRDTYYDKIFNAIDGIHNRAWGENKFVELGLEKYADGGSIPNNYDGKAVRHIWNSWSVSQRKHFLLDHNSNEVQDSYGEYRTEYLSEVEIENIAEVNYEDLPQDIKTKVFIHTDMGQYANGGGVGFRNTISRYNKMKELYQTNRESLEEINDYIDENYKGKKEEFIPLIYSVFPTTIKELGLTREDFVFWLNDPNYYQGYFSEDNIGEEDYANGGGVGKKLDWRLALGTHPKYYYGYNNGVIYATKEDNIELAEEWGGALYRRIKDIELVFPIKAKSFIDQESYIDFISLMLKTFPYREYSPTNGLTEVEIVEALNSDTMADGGVAYNPVWAEMEAYSPYSSRSEYENKKEYDDLAFASKSFSKSAEILVKENLMKGEICICKLRKILGHEPAYPVQYVGSIKLTKCFLKPFYKI